MLKSVLDNEFSDCAFMLLSDGVDIDYSAIEGKYGTIQINLEQLRSGLEILQIKVTL